MSNRKGPADKVHPCPPRFRAEPFGEPILASFSIYRSDNGSFSPLGVKIQRRHSEVNKCARGFVGDDIAIRARQALGLIGSGRIYSLPRKHYIQLLCFYTNASFDPRDHLYPFRWNLPQLLQRRKNYPATFVTNIPSVAQQPQCNSMMQEHYSRDPVAAL